MPRWGILEEGGVSLLPLGSQIQFSDFCPLYCRELYFTVSLPFGICGEIWHVVGTDVSLADGSRDEVGLFLPLFSLWVRSQEVVVSFLWLQFLSEGSSFAWSPSFRWAAPVVALVAASGQRRLLGSSGVSL